MDRIIEPDDIQLKLATLCPELVLSSKSENRRKLLEISGITVHQIPTETDEDKLGSDPEEQVLNIAREKMKAYLNSKDKMEGLPAITADTLVLFDNHLIGKAGTKREARETLKSFSGKKQTVITACLLYLPGKKIKEIVDEADVIFKDLSDDEIEEYLNTGEWMEAAGSYRLQKTGYRLVEKIEGDWTTVVGLPLKSLIEALEEEAD